MMKRFKMLATAALLGALVGCANPEGADTFTESGVLSGSTLTQAQCGAFEDTGVWVVVDGLGECLRYFHAGLEAANPVVHIWFHGDRMSQNFKGGAWVHDYYLDHNNPGALAARAENGARNSGAPYIRFSRPGVYGSTGSHKRRRLEREGLVIDAALEVLKQRYAIGAFALSGQSGGGHVVASLLPKRSDIVCAAITSGVVSVRKRSELRGWDGRDITGYHDFYDPIDHVSRIAEDENRAIFIIGDPRDSNVPFVTQADYYQAVLDAGHRAELIRAKGRGKQHHGLSQVGFQVVKDCLQGISPTAIARKHAS